ncbi:MAG: type II toxin-antitoxin system VapC family toxin [Pseudomonadota bacterium]
MILIDTHVLIWHIEGHAGLGQRARVLIETARREDGVLISAISAWEIVQLVTGRRLILSRESSDWIAGVMSLSGYQWSSVDANIAMRAAGMEWPHRDPADRFLVATAQLLRTPLLTADRGILEYGAAGHVEAIDARV